MSLRVMSYNVRYFGHALKGAGSTRTSLLGIARAIADLESPPDVVCLQEVETRSWRSRFSHTPGRAHETQLEALQAALDAALEERGRAMRYDSYYFPAHQYAVGSSQIYTTGLAVLASKDVKVVRQNSRGPHDITHRRIKRAGRLKQARIVAHVQLSDRHGTNVDVFNTHLSLPAFATKEFITGRQRMGYGRNQAAEVDQLAAYIEQEKHSDRFILLGDFNSLPDSPVYQRVLDAIGVRDPFPDLTGMSPLELRKRWPTAGFLHLRMRLDHVFLGRGIECLDLEESHPFGDENGRFTGLSDHVPLLARVRPLSHRHRTF
jgi:endonuclease/exonuclease/phosphatase family metal-dependent hydrolase